MDKANTSTIGLAISKDGVTIDERLAPSPFMSRAKALKRNVGIWLETPAARIRVLCVLATRST